VVGVRKRKGGWRLGGDYVRRKRRRELWVAVVLALLSAAIFGLMVWAIS
jgi:hypothetical protein